MANQLLEVKGLSVKVEDKEILHGINLEIKKGETHVLMGPNGAGKSTLGYALMGNPRYEVTQGEIRFQGKLMNGETADKRAGAGIFPEPSGGSRAFAGNLYPQCGGTAKGRQSAPVGFPQGALEGHGAPADGADVRRPGFKCRIFRR